MALSWSPFLFPPFPFALVVRFRRTISKVRYIPNPKKIVSVSLVLGSQSHSPFHRFHYRPSIVALTCYSSPITTTTNLPPSHLLQLEPSPSPPFLASRSSLLPFCDHFTHPLIPPCSFLFLLFICSFFTLCFASQKFWLSQAKQRYILFSFPSPVCAIYKSSFSPFLIVVLLLLSSSPSPSLPLLSVHIVAIVVVVIIDLSPDYLLRAFSLTFKGNFSFYIIPLQHLLPSHTPSTSHFLLFG